MGRRKQRTTITIPTTPIIVPTVPIVIPEGFKYYDNFESGSIGSFWEKEFATNGYAMTVVTDPINSANKCLRVELRKTDVDVSGSKRSEIVLPNELPLEEHWYNIDILLPNTYALDPNSAEILLQWHNIPDSGEEWTSPPLAFGTKNGGYYIKRLWDDAAITNTSQMVNKGNIERFDLGSYSNDLGKWVNWKFHIKWGWLTTQNPLIEIYKNDIKVYEAIGKPNTTNDKNGVYMKTGIYKWDWKENNYSVLTNRIIYLDNISVK